MGTKGYPSKVKKSKMRLESQRLADTERQRLRVTDTARQEETHPEEQGERQGLEEQWGRRKRRKAGEKRGRGSGEKRKSPTPPAPKSGRLRSGVCHVGEKAREGRTAASKGEIAAFLSLSFQ